MHTLATLALLLTMSSPVTPPSGQPAPMVPGDYTPAGPAQVVSWQFKRLAPPSPLYVGRDDVLRATAGTNQANEVVTITYRLLRASDGVVVPGQFTIKPPQNSTPPTQQLQPLAEGFLLSVSCQAAAAATRGQTFVRVGIAPSALGTTVSALQLMADYVTTQQAPAFPGGRVLSPLEGPGWIHVITPNVPAAGVDWGQNFVPVGRYRLVSVNAILVTSAQAGNRIPEFEVLGPTLQGIQVFTSTQVQAPSVSARYVWSAAPIVPVPAATQYQVPLPPDLILASPEQVQVATVGIQTLDQWSAIFLQVEEWLDNV